MSHIGRILREERPPALMLVVAVLAGAIATKGGHGLLAAGSAASFYPMYMLTLVLCDAVARLRSRFMSGRDLD
jgi:hypothetical protein